MIWIIVLSAVPALIGGWRPALWAPPYFFATLAQLTMFIADPEAPGPLLFWLALWVGAMIVCMTLALEGGA